MSDTPFIGFGNDTLKKQPIVHIGDIINCLHCNQEHTLIGDDNGGDLLLFFHCGEQVFLAAVKNRLVINTDPDVKGRL